MNSPKISLKNQVMDEVVANERITENLVRTMLKDAGYDSDYIDEQIPKNERIQRLLKDASKSGQGRGKPEFIVSLQNDPETLIVIECKASVTQHESPTRDQYSKYAVDGVLSYASYLKKEYNVIAIAVSGETEKEKRISTFLWLKNHYAPKDIQDKIILKEKDIANLIKGQVTPISEEELTKKAIEYNERLHDYAVPEIERCTFISAILIALQHEPFVASYLKYTNEGNLELLQQIFISCEAVLKKNHLEESKIKIILDEYKKFQNNLLFTSPYKSGKVDTPNTILRDFIQDIHQDILPHIKEDNFDVLGRFYTQFIRYAGSDQKIGLVLTPGHITDFFCDLGELTTDSVVLDPCCGTGGFLVSAMKYMFLLAGNNSQKKDEIRSKHLIGIEFRADMFTHTCSNMMMRGDGKSHIYMGDCFDKNLKELLANKEPQPNVSFLNPPYGDTSNAGRQLEFIENALEYLSPRGVCIAICQMSTAIGQNKSILDVRRRILEKHTLKAVLSMPNDLFHPIGVGTCILVFTAYQPHSNDKRTFFGYFKDDGFIKKKNKGRVDSGSWESIKAKWLETYKNSENIPGLSVMHKVSAEDEWCAEAYMETDYSQLTQADFEKTIKDYVAFQFLNLEKSNE